MRRALSVLFVLAACGDPEPADEATDEPVEEPPLERAFSFVVFADPHVTGPGDHADRLAAAVSWVNAHADERGIELVVVVGDIGWGGGLPVAREALEQLTVAYVPVLGDNEIHGGDEEVFDQVFEQTYADLAARVDDWHRGQVAVYNPDWDQTSWFQNFSFSWRGYRFVGLDWCSRDDDFFQGEGADLHDFAGGTWPWFEETMAGVGTAEEVLLFSHHPMHLSPGGFDLDEMSQITEVTTHLPQRIAGAWAGHYHFDATVPVPEGDYEVYITDATWDDENTVRVVEVHTNGWRTEYSQELVIVGL